MNFLEEMKEKDYHSTAEVLKELDNNGFMVLAHQPIELATEAYCPFIQVSDKLTYTGDYVLFFDCDKKHDTGETVYFIAEIDIPD